MTSPSRLLALTLVTLAACGATTRQSFDETAALFHDDLRWGRVPVAEAAVLPSIREAFVQQTRNATRLSEFLVRELVKRTNPNTAEGRAMLVHEAKPLLQKLSAPILRVQLTKEIAHRAQVSQAEIEAECGLKPLARTREYVAIVRKALAREKVAFEGEFFTLPLPDGPGKCLVVTRFRVRPRRPGSSAPRG